MPKKTFTPEQIISKLRQIEVAVSQRKTVPMACNEAGIVEQTFYWRKVYVGCKWNKPRSSTSCRERTCSWGGRAIADLTVEKQILKDIAEGNF